MDIDHLGKSRESQVSSCRGRLRQAGVKIAGKLSPNPYCTLSGAATPSQKYTLGLEMDRNALEEM